MTVLYFDCFSGASGDMILGALIDAGVPVEEVRRALGSLAIGPETVWTERVIRAGISATKFNVRGEGAPVEHAHAAHGHEHDHSHASHGHGADHSHGHPHGHESRGPQPFDTLRVAPSIVEGQGSAPHVHHHPHRSLKEIGALIGQSSLSATGKDRARALFQRLGEAEAAIHGTSLDTVHLHEVGALDSIIDIVGAVFALEAIGADRIVASPLNVGHGSIRSAHGLYPVPAPATVWLVQDAPIYSGAQAGELLTPTGALLVTAYASSYGPVPAMRVKKTGYGAGSRDFHDTPNVLRVLIGEADVTAPSHSVVVIEAEIDDMNPQIFGMLMERLLGDGALDVFYTPIQMKKNRPGTLLTIVAPPAVRERLTAIVFRETTTIGVRYQDMRRECLDRESVSVGTPFGAVRMKVARRNGEVLNVAPEFDDCTRLATATGAPVKDVQAAAMKAYMDHGQQ